ncbi:hypothetical protein PBY51_002365 [Eleginops maclovinus]|nr:hypothetical protein PBY51_002365 [Eleginops maclovinus]
MDAAHILIFRESRSSSLFVWGCRAPDSRRAALCLLSPGRIVHDELNGSEIKPLEETLDTLVQTTEDQMSDLS